MIELVLTVCLIGRPETCRDERPFFEAASPVACMVHGQIQAQRWLETHPEWRLVRWRCEVNLPRERRI